MKKLLKNVDIAINVAAESHVDNSFENSFAFTLTNTFGSHVFYESCKINKVKNILHLSTDEVYGQKIFGKSLEADKLLPSNPYSASKAAAEMIALSYNKSFKTNINIIRSNNLYGIRQYPEKLIPVCIINSLKNKEIPIHGNGKNIRHFLSVHDFCRGLVLIIKKTKKGTFNIGSSEKFSNIQIAKKIQKIVGNKNLITHVKDRPFNDSRYSISSNKIKKLGWKTRENLFEQLPEMILWYKRNQKLFK